MSKGPRPPKPQQPQPLPPVVVPDPLPSADPCADVGELEVISPVTPGIGTQIGVILDGGEVVVIGGGRRIGFVTDADGARLRECLGRGWRFHGEVIAEGGGRVAIRVFGVR